MGYNEQQIEGRNAVLEAFRAGRSIDRLFVAEGQKEGAVQTVLREAAKHRETKVHTVSRDKLDAMSDCIPESVVGVFGEKHFEGDKYLGFDYWIAAATTKECPEEFEVVEDPPAKWLVFDAQGPMPSSIQNIFGELYGSFFPNSKRYTRNWEVYEIESFTKGDPTSDTYISHAWVPVLEK